MAIPNDCLFDTKHPQTVGNKQQLTIEVNPQFLNQLPSRKKKIVELHFN